MYVSGTMYDYAFASEKYPLKEGYQCSAGACGGGDWGLRKQLSIIKNS